MGYGLEAIVCKEKLSSVITNDYTFAKRVRLKDDLFLIRYTLGKHM